MLTTHRDVSAARRLFEQAIDLHGNPESIAIHQRGANPATVRSLVASIKTLPVVQKGRMRCHEALAVPAVEYFYCRGAR